jgi:hypothetical protein
MHARMTYTDLQISQIMHVPEDPSWQGSKLVVSKDPGQTDIHTDRQTVSKSCCVRLIRQDTCGICLCICVYVCMCVFMSVHTLRMQQACLVWVACSCMHVRWQQVSKDSTQTFEKPCEITLHLQNDRLTRDVQASNIAHIQKTDNLNVNT